MKALKENLLGVFTAILYGINLIFIPTLLIVGGLISWLIPLKRFRHGMSVLLQWLSVQWFQLNNEIMKLHARGKIDIQGSGELSPERSYLLISNHRTWIDVILIGQAFNKKAPFLKDPANKNRDYMRSIIRHDIVPQVLKVNPGFYKVIKKKIMEKYK